MDTQHSSVPKHAHHTPGRHTPRSAAEPLPQRDPGKTLRPRPPATVGRPRPVPQRTAGVTR